MTLSFGGLGLLSPWPPFWDHARAGCRSLICALVVLAILLILAYLTNPSEVSFRAYLTEQSFRQHLSRLDDLTDDSPPELDCSDHNAAALPFHFANRASVSLRTPKHVFHSFGICTIATTRGAAVPASARRAHGHHHSDLDAFVSSDSWFIGAFGRWWRGGLVEPWYYDAVIRSKDAQAWSSGILGFKALDKFHEYNGLPFAKFTPCPRPLLRGAPPKLRNRERSAQRPGTIPHRTSSPPPLPKSASLPLHADHRLLPVAPQSAHTITDQKRIAVHSPPVAHTISRTSSTSGTSHHSVTIAEVTKQIAAAQTSIHDLQNQLQEAQDAANQSRDSLETEVGDLRSRRREEDQRRVDGRARTKTLEETRRLSETSKREAEKKMKLARNAKDSAIRRLEELELEIQGLKERMEHDRDIIAAEPTDADRIEEEDLIRELERKRKEVGVAEEVVVALNTRARELEEKIDESKSRLRAAQHRAQLNNAFLDATDSGFGSGSGIYQCNYGKSDKSAWSYDPFDVPADDVLVQSDTGSQSRVNLRSPELVGLSSALRAKGHTVFDKDTCCSDSTSLSARSGQTHNGYFQSAQVNPFSPFVDLPTPSAAFIPSSLISVLDSPSAELKGGFIQNGSIASSPVEYNGAESELDSSELGHAQGLSSHDQLSMLQNSGHVQDIARKSTGTTFAAFRNEKHRSSLNPDAKVFRLTRHTPDRAGSGDTSTTSSYDALNPTGFKSSITSSMPSSLLRAFAPSRAEREALQRALGGSTNTSLERLPSLSDVGSIPPSPVHEDTQGRNIGGKDRALPAWLHSLPLIRKPNFSPWEDEEPASTEVRSK